MLDRSFNIIHGFILGILLLSISFFYLTPISIWIAGQTVGLISSIFFIVNLKYIKKIKMKFTKEIIIFLLLFLVEAIISKYRYNQSWLDIILMLLPNLCLILYFIINYYKISNKKERIRKFFVNVSVILSGLIIFQAKIYEKFGVALLKISYEGERLNKIRITSGCYFVSIGMIITLAEILNKKNSMKKRKKYVAFLLIEFIYMIDIVATRSLLMYLTISLFFMILLYNKQLIKRIMIILGAIFISFILINTTIFKSFISISNDATEQWSNKIRVMAIEFYLEQIKEKPIFGTGLIKEKKENVELFYYLRGPLGKYYKEDIGIIGFVNTYGIVGLICYLCLSIKMSKIVIKKFKINQQGENFEFVGLYIFFIMCSISLIYTAAVQIIYLPFVLYLIEEK